MLEILKTLQCPPPDIRIADIEQIARMDYGVTGIPEPLGGERDQNFLIRTDRADRHSALLLKVANAAEPDDLLDLQCAALHHILQLDPSLPVQQLVQTLDGRNWTSVGSSSTEYYRVRAFGFLPGLPLYEAPADPRLMRDLGHTSAQLNYALRGFFHPAARHAIAWDTQNVDQLTSLCRHIQDSQLLNFIQSFLARFSNEVKPRLASCRAQLIHNDLTFHNSVVDPDDPTRIAGIFDFGDMVHAPLIQDLGLTAAEVPVGHKDPASLAAHIVAGFHAVLPLEDQEFNLLPDLIIGRIVLCLLIDAWASREIEWDDKRVHLDGWHENAAHFLKEIDAMGVGEFEALLRGACGLPSKYLPQPARNSRQQNWNKRNRYLGNAGYYSYDKPLDLVKGEGVWLYDSDDKVYLDAYNNVPHVGHCHPRVVAAIARQTATLNTNTRYLYDCLPDYAERLTSTLPNDLDVCYFVSSGSEANDLAWRLAKTWTGHSGGLVLENAYHGITDAVFDLSPAERIEPGAGCEHIEEIKAPDDYRGPWKRDLADRGRHYAALCDDAIQKLEQNGHRPAAFYMDMILSSSGIMVPPPGYTDEVYQRVRNAGGLCVADEVQSGFGRLGKTMWGFELAGVVPDIVTFGKPIAGGYPMGLVVTRKEIAEKFEHCCDFFSTTGGNPVACAAASAVLQVMQDEELMENAERIGNLLSNGVKQLAKQYPIVGDVRGSGLFIGVELVRDQDTLEPAAEEATAIANALKQEGVLIGVDGIYSNVLKIRPPMIINQTNTEYLLERLQNVLGES